MKIKELKKIIYNGENVPNKVFYEDVPYNLMENGVEYLRQDCGYDDWLENKDKLNLLEYCDDDDEVEIIEEDKKIEKLEYIKNGEFVEIPNNEILMNKINEIIDYLEENK